MGNECYNNNKKIYNTYNTYNTYISLVSNLSNISKKYDYKHNKRRLMRIDNYIRNNLLSPLNSESILSNPTKQILSPLIILSPLKQPSQDDKPNNYTPIYTSPFIMKAGSAYNSPINNISTIIRIENYIDRDNVYIRDMNDIDSILNEDDFDFVIIS